jgi:hypothetical protein
LLVDAPFSVKQIVVAGTTAGNTTSGVISNKQILILITHNNPNTEEFSFLKGNRTLFALRLHVHVTVTKVN